MTTIVVALVIFPPFAIGAVHPWPVAICEVAVFLLLIGYAVRIGFTQTQTNLSCSSTLTRMMVPVVLLGGVFTFQFIPLSPYIIRAISPATYEIYAQTIEGWPKETPYSAAIFNSDLPVATPAISRGTILPTADAVRQGATVPFAHDPSAKGGRLQHQFVATTGNTYESSLREWRTILGIPPTWMPLSLAPSLTINALIRFAAYAVLLFVVLGYPFARGVEGEERFHGLVCSAILVSGVLVASVGLLERVYWNGRILWFFIPQDWGAPLAGPQSRASGPFVNPDHFANYLAMIFPLALSGALFDLPIGRRTRNSIGRLLCGVATVLIALAISLSFSRAAWIATGATSVILAISWVRSYIARTKVARAELLNQQSSRALNERQSVWQRILQPIPFSFAARSTLTAGTLIAVMLSGLVVMVILGPQNRSQADARVGQTIVDDGGIGIRPIVWKATLRMARDYPVLGVGLASWPEIFPRYENGPWSANYFREAHNDYLQYFSETGAIGVILGAWLIGIIGARLFAAKRELPVRDRPIFNALLLGLAAIALHEIVDFSLHIPANALLFTVLLALALRIGNRATAAAETLPIQRPAASWLATGGLIALSTSLMLGALSVSGLAYPYDVQNAATPRQAREVLLSHPASARAHLSLVAAAGAKLPPKVRLKEIASAVWLDPTDPSIRDLNASMLVQAGKSNDGLEQIRHSVFYSPAASTHFYLRRQMIPWLLPTEQAAIESGFRAAIGANYVGAVDALGSFYEGLGRLDEQSELYADAARRTRLNEERARYLVASARAEIQLGKLKSAEIHLKEAVRSNPSNADAYAELVTGIYGPEKNLSAATSVTRQGINNGAEPVRLYMALSNTADIAGDEAIAEKCLLKALRYDPSFQTVMRVGQSFLQRGHFDRASSMLRNAVEIEPSSAEAYYSLAIAQERSYQYSEAEKAYARAALLAPQQYRPEYAAFRRRMTTATPQ